MANEDLFGIKPCCVLCRSEIPADRLRFKAVTCSKVCGARYMRWQQKKRDDKACKFCHRPSTPNARRAFSRFRVWEKENPEASHPLEWAIVAAAGVTLAEFGAAIAQAARTDIELDVELRKFDWERVKKPRKFAKPTPELDRVLSILAAYDPPAEEVADAAHESHESDESDESDESEEAEEV
jgi:hypothetical protein